MIVNKVTITYMAKTHRSERWAPRPTQVLHALFRDENGRRNMQARPFWFMRRRLASREEAENMRVRRLRLPLLATIPPIP